MTSNGGAPLKPAKRWVPDLLFDEPAKPAPLPSQPVANSPAGEVVNEVAVPVLPTFAESVATESDGTTTTVERVAVADPMPAPDTNLPEDREELARRLALQEKSLRDLRVRCRNLQDEIAKAKRVVMFCGRDKMASAKTALEALTNEHQQGETEERRLMQETLMLRSRIERSRR